MTSSLEITVRLSAKQTLSFSGGCLARVVALNHDGGIRRQFSVYSYAREYVAERIDYPDTIDVRYWGAQCSSHLALYDFFGNEPLANYLYGRLSIDVPGLRVIQGL